MMAETTCLRISGRSNWYSIRGVDQIAHHSLSDSTNDLDDKATEACRGFYLTLQRVMYGGGGQKKVEYECFRVWKG